MSIEYAKLLDRIYESAALPDLWPGVLDELAGLAGARGGTLFTGQLRITSWVSSAAIHDVARRMAEGDLVQSLFDLTASEARVAQGVARGYTVAEIAARRTVSNETVRTQMRAVLEKTGCRRQAEVVALLSGIPLARSEGPPDVSHWD